MRATRDAVCALTAAILISACGGDAEGNGSSDSGSTSTATGVLKDANVTGLEYRSGDRTGTTGSNGEFTYEIGKTVTFFIGAVTLGTADGAGVITPIDLASGDSADDSDVVNRVRFLLFLDSDNDPDNGIQVSDGVREIADNWSAVDFTTADLDDELTTIASDVQSIDGDATVPTAADAESHFTGTLRCLNSGAFVGTFGGDLSGRFAFLASAANGEVTGGGYTDDADSFFTLSSNSAVTLDTRRRFVSGSTSGGAEYTGRFDRDGDVSGDWESTTTSGTFAGARIAGDIDADFRFAGTYEDPDAEQDAGVYAFDVEGTEVTGTAYSLITGDTEAITGTISNGTDLNATTEDGTTITATIGTALDSLTGTATLTGNWDDGVVDGSFSGDGCRIN